MRITVRDLIVNAMSEARLVNRNQPVPANLFVDAFSLLKKRLDQYSNTNYLSFIRKEIDFEPWSQQMTIGETIYATPNAKDEVDIQDTVEDKVYSIKNLVYFRKEKEFWSCSGSAHGVSWGKEDNINFDDYFEIVPDIEVKNMQEVVRCYVKNGNGNQWDALNFVAYEDFYNMSNDYIYSVLPIDDCHAKVFWNKDWKKIKIIYNEAFDFGPDDELNIPRQFVTLFTSALVYDLAMQYPRMSDTTVAMLKERLHELEENVRRSSSVSKFIGRDIDYIHCTWHDAYTGRFLQ